MTGLTITGSSSRNILIRAGSDNADTSISLFAGAQLIASNNDWNYASNATAIANAAAKAGMSLAAGGHDPALLVSLAPGAYTVQVNADSAASENVRLDVVQVP